MLFIKIRIQKFIPCFWDILFLDIAWEFVVPPLFKANATSDILDIIAYVTGSIIYALLAKLLMRLNTKNVCKIK